MKIIPNNQNSDFVANGFKVFELVVKNINRDNIEIQFMIFRQAGGNTLQVPTKGRTFFTNICRRPFTKQFPFISLEFHKFDENIIRKTKETVAYGRKAIKNFSHTAEYLINKKVNNVSLKDSIYNLKICKSLIEG